MLKKRGAELWIVLIAAGILLLDQVTKALVVRYLPDQVPWNPIPFLGRLVTLTLVRNTGAAFGLLSGQSSLLTVVAVGVMAMILLLFRQLPYQRRLIQLSLGLQLGGAVGNLIDRLRVGHVIDFIDFHFWPVFNVADSAIVIGVIILAYYLLFLADKEQGHPASVADLSSLDSSS